MVGEENKKVSQENMDHHGLKIYCDGRFCIEFEHLIIEQSVPRALILVVTRQANTVLPSHSSISPIDIGLGADS